MAKNKLSDLNDHLFAQLERLDDDNLKEDQMANEVFRAKAITAIAAQIIKTQKLALDAMKLVADGKLQTEELPQGFEVKRLNAA